jgi:hypothetical protein
MSDKQRSLRYLILASLLTIGLSFVPMASFIVYPFRLFVTFIHEGGHALATLLTLGQVERIELYRDASGVTLTRGGMGLLVSSAGYLTSTLYGALLLIVGRRSERAKGMLALTAAFVLGMTIFYVRGLFGLGTGICLTALLTLAVIFLSQRVAHFLLNFLAVQCCLNALYDLNTLFLLSVASETHSDARNMQAYTGIPAVLWSLVWLGISVFVLFKTLSGYRSSQSALREYHEPVNLRQRSFSIRK